ncbi:MAG: ABC transporter ATP-binding protein [Nitrospirae bacterium]|nr:ABC transporter ATP-binding protein [Nitrospirota bacterium]
MLRLIDISKVFQRPDGKLVYGLRDINLIIGKGEFVSIVGPSGSGKSTLMNILGCLDRPTSGQYLIDGSAIHDKSDNEISAIRSREIGFIFQSFNLLEKLNAVENVELPLVYRKVPQRRRRIEAYRALRQVGLQEKLFYKPNYLSGGQQQRVAIARALVARPSIIFGDEPTGALDPITRTDIINIIRNKIASGNTTVVIVTHDMEIAKMTNRVLKIHNGMITEDRAN